LHTSRFQFDEGNGDLIGLFSKEGVNVGLVWCYSQKLGLARDSGMYKKGKINGVALGNITE